MNSGVEGSDFDNNTQDDEEIDHVTPEETVAISNMAEEVPDTVPLPSKAIDDEEPNPEAYGDFSQYIHDLLEFEIGYRSDQAAEDPANPGSIAGYETVLEGDILDVEADQQGVSIFYRMNDNLLEEPEDEIESTEDMPEAWADIESTLTVEYDAEDFNDLRKETKRAAEYIRQVDGALSNQENPGYF